MLDFFHDGIEGVSILAISKIDESTIKELIEEIDKMEDNSKILFIEEHFKVGGLFEAVAPRLLSLQKKYQVINMSINHQYTFKIQSHNKLIKSCGIDFNDIKNSF